MSGAKRRKSKWWLAALAVFLVIASATWWVMRGRAEPTTTYREMRVERTDLNVTIASTGLVQPENRLEIKPPIAGRVEQVLAQEGQRVRKGQILAWMSSTERAALLDAARAKGAEELRRWEDLYRPTPIMAPINGTVILRNIEAGQTFSNVDSVFVMSDRLTVKAQVDETDIAQIRLKQAATIVLDAYPERSIAGQVDQIAFEAKTVNNVTTYTVDVLPRETPEFLRSGMTANVTFTVASKQDVLTVPSEAVRTRAKQSLVLVKSPDGAAPIETPIQVGLSDGKRVEVVSGVSADDIVLAPKLKTGKRAAPGSNPFSPTRR